MAMVLKGPPFIGYDNRQLMMDDAENRDDDLTSQSSRSESRMSETDYRPVSALARGVQITEFAESRVNPTPLMLDEADLLIEQYLSPGKLQMLTGADDLKSVESLELKVDTRETSLGNFGSLVPNLTELKLSGSCISSARDLGSSLHNLKILWLTRCGLEELDGISSMLSLRELFLEYNEISDLSPLSMLEEIQVLDLEGNNIDDISQVQYLSLCPKLHRLALDGNPVCVMPTPTCNEPDYNYRNTIRKYLPQIHILDDEILGDEDSSSNIRHNVFDEDWAYLEELQNDAFLTEEFLDNEPTSQGAIGGGDRPITAALRPATSYRPGSSLRPSSGFRPLSASRRTATMSAETAGSSSHPPSTGAHRPVSSDAVEGMEASSELTIGDVICGNPSKALRQRKTGGAKEEIQKGLNKLLQKGAVFSHSEEAQDEPFRPEEEMNSIIEELQSWKVEHEKRMKEILKTKEAQVLVVDHDEAEDVIHMSGSEDEFDDDLELEKEVIDYRPPSSWHRHKADLRLRSKADSQDIDDEVEASGGDATMAEKHKSPSVQKIPMQSKYAILRKSVGSFDTKENGDNVRTSPDDRLARPDSSSSLSGASGYQRPLSRSGGHGDSKSDLDISPRPRSRGQTDPENLGPLRAPSPSSAQVMNSMRSKQVQSPPSPKAPRKLRVGPTGLPLSSQQPVIRNSITPSPSSRLGSIPQPRPPPSRGNIALLPSQPRVPRHLPEPPSLLPHPPPKH